MTRRLRRQKLLLFLIGFCLIGGVYGIVWKVTGIGFPCVFYEITHLQCPGCGVTRMISCLLQFDFVGAFRYNSGIFMALPFLAVLFLLLCRRYVQQGRLLLSKKENILVWGIIIWLLLFGIGRNLW